MPSWKEYERFLINDGWTHVPTKSGRDKYYQKEVNGELWNTRVSKSSSEIGNALFARILKQQVMASKGYFNKVKNKKPKDDWDRMM